MATHNTVLMYPRTRANIPQKEITNQEIYINNIYIRARAREEDRQLITAAFVSQLGYWPTPAILEQLIAALDEGAEVSLLCAVLEYTAQTAPKPSWPYARTVLQRQMKAGVKDAEGFNAACEAFRQAKPARPAVEYKGGYYKNRVIEQRYEQRRYDPEEYDQIPEDQIAEMAKL